MILGLSYKPNTDVVEQAQGLLLAGKLAADGVDVTVFDPVAMDKARAVLGDSVRYAASLADALAGAAVIFVANPDRAFAGIDPGHLTEDPVVIDAWRMFRPKDGSAPAPKYLPLGVAPADEELNRYLEPAAVPDAHPDSVRGRKRQLIVHRALDLERFRRRQEKPVDDREQSQ